MTYAELFGMKKSLTKPTTESALKTTPVVPEKKSIVAKTESAFKNNKGFINPSEIKKSLIPKK